MAKPWVHATDKIAGFVPPKDRLDSVEKDGLEMSTAAVMYQQGGSLDARILLLSCVAGIALPRILKYIDQREEERKGKPKVEAVSEEVKQLREKIARLELESKKPVNSNLEIPTV
jgi:hypothetical protein